MARWYGLPARWVIAAARTPGLASAMQAGERLARVGWAYG
jgi:hypothetical protein